MDEVVVMARTALLDALEALHEQLDALVIVGAQAVYMHTGAAPVALAEFTTDADVAIDPDLLSAYPLVEAAMQAGGFEPNPLTSAIGITISSQSVPVDLMIPTTVPGEILRRVETPTRSSKAVLRARSLDAPQVVASNSNAVPLSMTKE